MTTPRVLAEATRPGVHAGAAPAPMLPWAEAIASRWQQILGDCPERDAIQDVISRSLAGSTAENYSAHLARFIRWCELQPDRPSPLPASTGTVLRWLAADVTAADRVKAGSLQPYLSSINRVHRDLEYSEPALGHLVQQFRRGLAHRQADAGRDARRVYLPPDVVERLLLWALSCSLHDLRADDALASRFRAAVAVVLSYCLFVRGGTGARLLDAHVRRSAAGITVTLDHEKGKRVEGTARTLTFAPDAIPGLEPLLERWEALRGAIRADRCYFAFAAERRAFPASQIDAWLGVCLAHLGASPPAGEKWTGHSLRKGAASGAASIGVPLHVICYAGGWSIKSKAVFDYIDPTCPRSLACRRFFGWLAPS